MFKEFQIKLRNSFDDLKAENHSNFIQIQGFLVFKKRLTKSRRISNKII